MEGKKGALYYSTEENHLANSAQTFFHWIKNPEKLKCHQKKGRFKQYFLYFYIAGMLDIYETQLNCLPEKVFSFTGLAHAV